jgi:hypothetical protein
MNRDLVNGLDASTSAAKAIRSGRWRHGSGSSGSPEISCRRRAPKVSPMALPLSGLKAIPSTILASGGSEELPIVRAIPRAGYARKLATDEATAERLI